MIMDKKLFIFMVVVAALLMLLYKIPDNSIKTIPVTATGVWDISSQVETQGYKQYLVEEKDFDYSNKDVFTIAQDIKKRTSSPKEAIQEAIRFTVQNIKYSPIVDASYCYSETASSVLNVKEGDCVSMSRLNTALFRAMGIPARTMGGCLSAMSRCGPLFAAVPGLEAKTVVMAVGDYKKRGFLHEWVEAWTPETGWLLIESTSGQSFPLECNAYLQYGYDSNNRDRCIINSNDFVNQCRGY